MPRIARVVAPGLPHHITQRGNRRQKTFFCEGDYLCYMNLLAHWCAKLNVEIWAYCLMPNHVHLIAVPHDKEGLCRAIGEAHRRYTRYINFREGWRGYLWQGRFASYPMDEGHLLAAVRYIELNPVRARIVEDAGTYRWSSAAAHLSGELDPLANINALFGLVPNWGRFLEEGLPEEMMNYLRLHERTGRPIGDDKFIKSLEADLGRMLMKGKPGPRKRVQIIK